MPCEIPPPSLQLAQTSCALADAFCGVVTAMVCPDDGAQLNVCGAVNVTPSAAMVSPDGLVVTVTLTVGGGGDDPSDTLTVVLPSLFTTALFTVALKVPELAVTEYVPAGSGMVE